MSDPEDFLARWSRRKHDAGQAPQSPGETGETEWARGAQEIIRVRALPTWLRVDARFGSVYRRRGQPALMLR